MNTFLRLILVSIICILSSFSAQLMAADNNDHNHDHNLDNQAAKYTNSLLILGDNHMSVAKMKMLQAYAKDKNLKLDYKRFKDLKAKQATSEFSQYELVIFDVLSARLASMMLGQYKAAMIANPSVKFDSPRILANNEFRQGIDAKQAENLTGYYFNGGRENYQQMMSYISAEIFSNGNMSYAPFVAIPETGYYHYRLADKVTDKTDVLQNAISYDKNKPVIAVAIHREAVESDQTQIVDATLKQIENSGAQGFAYFFASKANYSKLLVAEKDSEKGVAEKAWIDAILNQRMIHYMDKRKADFEKLDVPVLHALAYNDGDQSDYEKDHAGLSATMSPYFLMMPETSGVIDPTIITAQNPVTHQQEIIDYQFKAFVERAILQAKLKHTANRDKKVAIMIWNYPPGEKNIGAAFLNVPKSLDNITNGLIAEGYSAEQKDEQFFIDNAGGLLAPLYRTGHMEALKSKNLTGHLPLADYQAWFATLPQTVQDEINQDWGLAKDQEFIELKNGKPHFMVARMQNGNIITLPQPSSSSSDEEKDRMYHDTSSPASHYYLAVYLYVKKTFGADAIVHLGTHGSQEWLKGKERGLSIYDSPSLSVGNLPVIYPFIMDNVGEAMQAKRRGRATMISHLTPGFAAAGMHSDIEEIDELIHQFEALDEGQTKNNTQKIIDEKIEALNIKQELRLTDETSFDEVLAAVHRYLYDLAQEAQPLGLHTFGITPQDSHIITTIQQMLAAETIALAHDFEKDNNLEAMMPKEVVGEIFSAEMEKLDGTQLTDIDGFKLLWLTIIEGKTFDLDDELAAGIVEAKKYYQGFINQQEMPALVNALQGGYTPILTGGDPIRNPEAMPTGKNLIGFNPAKVPSQAAYEAGKALVEDSIAKYHSEHGQFPDKLAFSLWSLETMRQHGVLESQIMAALGVKPKWDRRGMVVGTETIEYSELKRPRIDVAISATGLYRDAFPNVMLLLAKAIKDIAELKEESNSVYKNAQSLKAEFLENGASEEDALYLSSVRIFSNDTGAYGTGLDGATLATDTWEQDDKLADLYMSRMGYAFGADASRWSEKVDAKTIGNLYGKVLTGTDAVIFSRSSNLYGMITSDDPFQYFGGIALAVRNLDGESPEMYISNLRKTSDMKNETLDKFLGRELRTRTFHPRWIEEMQKEGYSGALTVLDRMNNFWGWTVMDPDSVNNAQWQEFVEVYVNDKYDMQMKEFFEKNNPYALAQMVERILEAERKEYFQTDEATLEKLTETYLEMANKYDIYTDNEVFKDKLENLAQGFGLDFTLPEKMSQQAMEAIQNTPQPNEMNAKQSDTATEFVTGQKLEKQSEQEVETDYQVLWVSLVCLLIMLMGGLYQVRFKRERVELV